MNDIKTRIVSVIAVLLMLAALPLTASAGPCTAVYGTGSATFALATGSPGELGLLEALAGAFSQKEPISLCWQKAGSGKSLQLLKDKQVDMVMVHAPAAEKAAIAEGWATARHLIGSNEFYIVGPPADPAGIAAAKTAADAYAKIAATGAPFFSRGDNSGTHKKELAIWKKAGIAPSGSWYIITKTFMMATLEQANARGGYFMTDSSTWVAGKKRMSRLAVLFRGDPFLINTYHTLCQPAGATAGQPVAERFIRFVSTDEGQRIIREFGMPAYGEGLYKDAAYAKQYDH